MYKTNIVKAALYLRPPPVSGPLPRAPPLALCARYYVRLGRIPLRLITRACTRIGYIVGETPRGDSEHVFRAEKLTTIKEILR